ncbi:MAG: ATP synthase F1 subunit epsilon [Acidimicrobiia bacterium]
MALHVELVSPERIIYSGEADMVLARTTDGEIAFLTGHAPFIGALGIGQVVVTEADGTKVRAAVHGGFVEVSHDRVTVLSDVAELSGDIDRSRAEAALRRAEEAVRASSTDEDATDALRRAQVRLDLLD